MKTGNAIIDRLLSCIILLAIFSVGACDELASDDPPEEEVLPIMPLSVGNSWEYQKTVYTADQEILSVDTIVTSVLGNYNVNIDGEEFDAYAVKGFYNVPALRQSVAQWLVSSDSSGLFLMGEFFMAKYSLIKVS